MLTLKNIYMHHVKFYLLYLVRDILILVFIFIFLLWKFLNSDEK